MKWSEFSTGKKYKAEDYEEYKDKIKEVLTKIYDLQRIYYTQYYNFISGVFDDYKTFLEENGLNVCENWEYDVIGKACGEKKLQLYVEDGDDPSNLVIVRYKNDYPYCINLFIKKDDRFNVVNEWVGWLYVDKEIGELKSHRDINDSEKFYKEQLEKIVGKYNKLKELFTVDNGEYKLRGLVLNIEVSYNGEVVGRYPNGRKAIDKAIECFE